MKSKIFSILALVVILFSCSNSKRKEVSDNVFLEKDGGRFNLYSEMEDGKWKYFDVDSFAMDSGAFLLHGRQTEKEPQKWYAVGVPSKELQEAATNAIHGGFKNRGIYAKLKSPKTVWAD